MSFNFLYIFHIWRVRETESLSQQATLVCGTCSNTV